MKNVPISDWDDGCLNLESSALPDTNEEYSVEYLNVAMATYS